MKNTSRIAGAALALGVLSGVFAPSASAADLPDLVTGTLYFKGIAVYETASLTVVVKNNGTAAAGGAAVDIDLGPGLALLHPVDSAGWHCTSPVRSNSDGATRTTCSSNRVIQPDGFETLGLDVHGEPGQQRNRFYVALDVDPDHRINESDEDNNVNISHY